MRAVVQRVSEAFVDVDDRRVVSIGRGIVIFAGFGKGDSDAELDWMARKCLEMRIFEGGDGRMNFSVSETAGEVLVISQFTLFGDCGKGRRPDFTASAPAAEALKLYRRFLEILEGYYPRISEGVFGAHMMIGMVNDGPVTLFVERGGAGE
jgi:D-tyrosyl-tRNA(Tyr) deacylase